MTCPYCGTSDESYVVDSRGRITTEGAHFIRRRRGCGACHRRWTTVEIPADLFGANNGTMRTERYSLLAMTAGDLNKLRAAVDVLQSVLRSSITPPVSTKSEDVA